MGYALIRIAAAAVLVLCMNSETGKRAVFLLGFLDSTKEK
jgi:hypothetical protein